MAACTHTAGAMIPCMSWVYATKANIVPPEGLASPIQANVVMRNPPWTNTTNR